MNMWNRPPNALPHQRMSPAQQLAEAIADALSNFLHPDEHGRHPRPTFRRDGTQYTDDFFVYPVSLGSLTASGGGTPNATGIIQIQADSDFEWIMTTFGGYIHGTAAGTVLTDAIFLPINAQIADSGSGRQLFNAPMPISCFAGNGKQPFINPVTRKFMARSTIQVTATNTDPNNQYDDVFLNFIGRKVFKFGRQRQDDIHP